MKKSHGNNRRAASSGVPDQNKVSPRRVRGGRRSWLRRLGVAESVCRACGRPASLFMTICTYCGARNPVQVNISPSLVVTGVGCELSLILLRLI